MAGGARLSASGPPNQSLRDFAARPAAKGGGVTLLGLFIFLPTWSSRPLGVGDFSLAFAIPFALAAYALMRPARPGSFQHAFHGGAGRGLGVEAASVTALLLLAFMSMLVSPEPLRAFRVILPMSYFVCVFIVLARVPAMLRRQLIFSMFFAAVAVLGVALILSQVSTGRSIVMRAYRLRAFLENSNQLGLMILAIWPLSIALLLTATTAARRVVCWGALLILSGSILLSGTKTALLLGFVSGSMLWLYHASQSGSLGKTVISILLALCAIVLAVPAILWLLSWASPTTFEKINTILSGGVWQYQSMQTRDGIWAESIRIGLLHPFIGAGAGTWVFGYPHSHNMSLDYFRGMGVFGFAAAIALTISAISRGAGFLLWTGHKGVAARPSATVTAAMYLGAIFYLIGNHLSDSFSPTTAFVFWMVYLGAYFADLPALPARQAVRLPSTREWAPHRRSWDQDHPRLWRFGQPVA